MADKANHGELKLLPLADVIPSAANPRILRKDDPKLAELTASIRALGVLAPVLVRPMPGKPGEWELLAGSRRRAAAQAAGLKKIPALVRELDDRAALAVIVTENLQREDLTPYEEARGVRALLEGGFSAKEAAAELGRSGAWIVRRAQLTRLAPAWQKLVADPEQAPSRWPAAWLEQLAVLAEEAQLALLEHWTAEGWLDDNAEWEGGMIEAEIARLLHELKRAPWARDDATLTPKDPPCSDCPNRSSQTPGLFDELDAAPEQAEKNDRCLNAACWARRRDAFLARERERLTALHGEVLLVSDYYGSQVPEGALTRYQIEPCKKNAAGAKPCLRADGPGEGTFFWGQPRGEAEPHARAERQRDADGKPEPLPLAERRENLRLRREALVNRWLKERLRDEDDPPPFPAKGKLEALVALAAAFGTADNAADRAGDEVMSDEPLQAWAALRNEETPARRLWAGICGVLEERLNFFPPAKNVPTDEHEALCELLKLDLAALRRKAAEEIPEPKSWAKLAEPEKSSPPRHPDTKKTSSKGRKAEQDEPADATTFAEPERKPGKGAKGAKGAKAKGRR